VKQRICLIYLPRLYEHFFPKEFVHFDNKWMDKKCCLSYIIANYSLKIHGNSATLNILSPSGRVNQNAQLL
jgi:hypothetical protein